ncbi:MAG: carbohydrate kinase family protein [Gemmatimonadota bacterium]|jgi:sugar/nucleoside kinase (ribokinase family)
MRLGVLGTMVWDRIHARDVRSDPVEEWGGIAYALAGVSAAADPEWTIVPLIKVGSDLEEEAFRFLRSLPRADLDQGLAVVPEPNNRVELHYRDRARRTECLTGGVPAWRWEELEPRLQGLDALYVNFISGFELDLETAARLRLAYAGPIYADLHSLLLGVGPDGIRQPRQLAAWRDWMRCFDMVQLNEDELGWLAGAWGDPWRLAADVVADELRLLLVTLGERGAAYVASPAFQPQPLSWRDGGLLPGHSLGTAGAARSGRVTLDGEGVEGDPTGCGDVWGATMFAALLRGHGLEAAMAVANRAASRNVRYHGATGLHDYLMGRIAR